MTPQLIRKISARHVVGSVKAIAPRENADGSLPRDIVPLFRVFGQATGIKKGESDNGPWTALTGRFEAVSLVPDPETGELEMAQFAAPQCFLPEPTNSMIATELESGDINSIEFGFEVGVKAAKTAVGYEYTCSPLMERGGADPLAALREKMKALPLPKKLEQLSGPTSTAAAKGGKKK